MQLYLAAVYTSNFDYHGSAYARLDDNEKHVRNCLPHILESYHYIGKQTAVDKLRRDGARVFLDSGAFSAFTQGTVIDLDQYCRYVQTNQDIILIPSVLDAVGDPVVTLKNQKAMEERGVTPIPCFHYGEDESYLAYYVENYDYLSLGGMVPISTPQLKIWLDRIWPKYLCNPDGSAKIKVHGFGLTTISLMEGFPWASVDSTGWQAMGSNGTILLPDKGMIAISDSSPRRKIKDQHFLTMNPNHQEYVRHEIERRNYDVDRLIKSYLSRWVFNMQAYMEIMVRINKMNVRCPVGEPLLFA